MALNSTPSSLSTGTTVTAAFWNTEVRDVATGIQAAWTTYTPTWTAATTNPTLGNGTQTGRYQRVGKNILARIDLTLGSTTTIGSGIYSFALPVTAIASDILLGQVLMLDASPQTWYTASAYALTTTTMSVIANAQSASWASSGTPFVPAQNDKIRVILNYEAA